MPNKQTLFQGFLFLLLAFNLLAANDYTTLWSGAESFLAWRALHGAAGMSLHEQILAWPLADGALSSFWLRLPGGLLLLLALPLYYALARPLFGKQAVMYTLLLLAASLLAPNLAKLASGDSWSLVLQWLSFAALIRYLKQPKWSWQLLFYALFALAIWVQPLQALIFILGTATYLYIMHPQGKALWRLNPWAMGGLTAASLYAAQLVVFGQHAFYFGFQTGPFLLANLIGILPFLGFVLAGVWEYVQRRGEELAILHLGALAFALIGHSMALPAVLAMIAAKPLRNYFDDRYPYRSLVQAGAVLQLVAAACLLIFAMITSFFEFGGLGFRAGLAAGGLYWMMSFIAVIGLVAVKQRYMIMGTLLSGLLFSTAFWLQVNPLLESQRQWARQIVAYATEQSSAPSTETCAVAGLSTEGKALFPNVAVYSKLSFPKTELLDSPAQAAELWPGPPPDVFLLPPDWLPPVDTSRVDTVRVGEWMVGKGKE